MATTPARRRPGRPKGSGNRQATAAFIADGFYEPYLFLADTQVPFQDEQAIWAVELLMKDLQPKKLIHLGDHWDFYSISQFSKNPNRAFNLQDEIDEGAEIWKRWRKILPNASFELDEGNHEDRLRKHLWSDAPELASLRALDFGELIGAKEYGLKTYAYNEGHMVSPTFMTTHGNLVRKNTAAAMLAKHGISGASAHVHTLDFDIKTDRSGTKAWYCLGCLCSMKPEYTHHPNWQHGLAVGWFKKSGYRFQFDNIPMSGRAFIYGGKRYGVQ